MINANGRDNWRPAQAFCRPKGNLRVNRGDRNRMVGHVTARARPPKLKVLAGEGAPYAGAMRRRPARRLPAPGIPRTRP